MNAGARLAALVVVLAVGAGTALAAGRDSAPPVSSVSDSDPTGDAGSGPDLTSLSATVSGSGLLTLTATMTNGIGPDQSVQFFIDTPDGGELNIAEFDDGDSILSVWDGSQWQGIHDGVATLSGNTLTSTVALADLQSAVHQSVEPALLVSVESSIHADAPETPVVADAVPDSGWMGVATVAQAPTPTATSAPPPPPAYTATTSSAGGRAKKKKTPAPSIEQRVSYLPHSRVEWRQLSVQRVPTGATVAISCSKGCKLAERPRVVHGIAVSKRFIGRPFGRGVTFVVRVRNEDGSGWWISRSVIPAKPGQPEIENGSGCIAKSGALGTC